MTRVTEGYLARHYQGVRGGRDAAMLDIAQDHALYLLHRTGAFKAGLVFKGGTALRKFRAGSAGRFSTDLDFAASSEELALAVLSALDGAELEGFAFAIANLGDDGRRGDLVVDTPFGRPQLGAKVELARHALSLPPETLRPLAMPVHGRYNFTVPPTPVIRVEEAIAEKLARYRRVPLTRDLYDLQWFGNAGAFDHALVRRLWVLKTYRDVVVDGRGDMPIDPGEVLRARSISDFRPEDIGYLTQPIRIAEWIDLIGHRYAFLMDVDAEERRYLACNARDRHEVETRLASAVM